jgi:Nickel responsive protein SCO4226-like
METGLYLVERYLPGASDDDVASALARVQAAVEQLVAEGVSVRYRGGIFIPADETCFCEFEASSKEAVEWANERANAPFARIVTAVRLSTRRPRRRSA